HLLIWVDGTGQLAVAPAGPDAVCRVDGERLAGPIALHHGQVLTAGRSLIAFGRPGEPEPPAAPHTALPGAVYLEAPPMPLARAAGLALSGTAVGTALA